MSDAACLRFPLDRYPQMNPFVLAWMKGDPAATRFLPRIDGPLSRVKPTTHRKSAPSAALVNALARTNRAWGRDVSEELARWAKGGTFVAVAGQQVGFMGGPLYTLVKLASLIRLKRDNEAAGIPTTAFFWLATEDHDFREVAEIALPRTSSGQRDLVYLRATQPVDSRRVVGPQPIPETLVEQLLAAHPMERPAWLRKGISFGDSFAELLNQATTDSVILVDALLPELRREGETLFQSILSHWDAIQSGLTQRSRELSVAGFTPQVIPREGEGYTLLFRLDSAGNREILDRAAPLGEPERISTSALTRPLLQDAVLRPDVFIGGPAEVAYYAQIEPLHRLLNVPLPRVALRAHTLLAPRRILRTCSRYSVGPADWFATADSILAEREPEGVAEIRSIAAKANEDLAEQLTRIGEIALPAEHALARAINRSIGHIEYHFGKLTERAIRGLARKDRERTAAIREIVAALFPDGTVQDRVVGWFAYWSEFGNDLIEKVIAESEADRREGTIVPL
jgi:Uncharacterized protein conserved in bacteria